ncbi:hypothetical protein IJ103_02310 [Candidatus Saccharibacteria bacterium]|nr:hypothetical protein [Candidatus Saccharibacteria bacterium]MBQ9017052.1 hypothetical protein [Candidatus Saccharibacteria bacterium]
MLIVEQPRTDTIKTLEELTFSEQMKLVTKADEEIQNKSYMALADFRKYMGRKYPRARAV